jgi:PAS domain S-box-containing protein
MEQMLSDCVEMNRIFFNNEIYSIVMFDAKSLRILYVNDTHVRMYGYSKEELLSGMTALELSAEPSATRDFMQNVAKTGDRLVISQYHRKKEGTEFPVEIIASRLSRRGHLLVCGIVQDITERKQVEKRLEESLALVRASLDATADGILVIDNSSKVVDYNNKFMELWKIPSELMLQKDDDRLIQYILEQLKHPEEFLRRVRELYSNLEVVGFDKIEFQDGRIFERYSIPYRIEGRVAGRVWSFRDVTERKQAEEALRRSEKKFRELFDSATDAIFILDLEGNFIDANRSAYERLGYTKEEMLAMHVSQLEPPEFAAKTPLRIEQHKKSGHLVFESVHLKKNGTPMPVEIDSRLINFDGKKAYFSVNRDITERKQAEDALRDSNQSYRTLAENLPGIVYRVFTRENNRIHFFNKAAVDIIGCSESELSQGLVCALESRILEEDRTYVQAVVTHAIEARLPFTLEYRLRHIDGSIRFLLEKGTPIYDTDKNILFIDGVIFDITEQKRLQDELVERKSEERAMDKVLMDIHDGIGGITTNITLLAELAKKASKPEDTEKALETISDLALDGMMEIRSLMYSLDREDLDWRTLAVEIRNQGSKLLEAHRIEFEMTSDIEENMLNPTSHLCLNLFRIYREALVNVIKHAKATKVKSTLRANKERFVLIISDNGQGFKHSAPVGSGRGIGNMKTRAASMHGTVTFTGEGGTCVTIEIPLALKPIIE